MTTLTAGLTATAQAMLDVVSILREDDWHDVNADTHVGAPVYGFDPEGRGIELQVHDHEKATALARLLRLLHLHGPTDSDGETGTHRTWTGTVGHDRHPLRLTTILLSSAA